MTKVRSFAIGAIAAVSMSSAAGAQQGIFSRDYMAEAVTPQPLALPPCSDSHLNPATMVHLRISPGSQGSAPDGQLVSRSNGQFIEVSQGNGGKILGYTRIRILYRSCGGEQRDYVGEKRDDIARFFLGKHAQKFLTIEAQVTPLDVKTSRPVASINRDSTKQGEVWDTQIENNGILFPYFRVDRSSLVNVTAKLHSAREYQSTIAADTLDIVQRASALISPTTALITTENKGRFNEAAGFVDTAVQGLLKVSIDEQVRYSVPLNPGVNGQVLGIITLRLPIANDVYRSKTDERMVGQWVIYAEPLRLSMLDDVNGNGPIRRTNVSAAAVLNYLVDDKKTLREALSGVQSLVTARDALVKTAGNTQSSAEDITDKARPLCRIVANESLSLGMTPVDAGAAAWAYLTDLALPKGKMKDAETGCGEVEFYPLS